ncbi:hypothetical protein AJ80_02976 [Polytolypa hystricis UAMH7299]|uniref:Uncharacterized protein n=1 Tax=Polytolypa hystricis (strain UAMH7299) TaxID=1447883 RepID=A0A2B7YQK3_POLH7|nr:hypothetical protein AJ80_02976 [Polytolypa hystricis UAMH7299]
MVSSYPRSTVGQSRSWSIPERYWIQRELPRKIPVGYFINIPKTPMVESCFAPSRHLQLFAMMAPRTWIDDLVAEHENLYGPLPDVVETQGGNLVDRIPTPVYHRRFDPKWRVETYGKAAAEEWRISHTPNNVRAECWAKCGTEVEVMFYAWTLGDDSDDVEDMLEDIYGTRHWALSRPDKMSHRIIPSVSDYFAPMFTESPPGLHDGARGPVAAFTCPDDIPPSESTRGTKRRLSQTCEEEKCSTRKKSRRRYGAEKSGHQIGGNLAKVGHPGPREPETS